MKYKILLKSALALAIILTFSAQVYASEVTGFLSSSNIQGGGSSFGSEVGGTLSSGTMAGIIGGGSTSSRGGNSNRNTGAVLGASTGGSSNNGEVLGTTSTPGFPATGLGSESTSLTLNLIGMIVLATLLMMYSYYRSRKNA